MCKRTLCSRVFFVWMFWAPWLISHEEFSDNQNLKKEHEKSLRKYQSLLIKQEQLLRGTELFCWNSSPLNCFLWTFEPPQSRIARPERDAAASRWNLRLHSSRAAQVRPLVNLKASNSLSAQAWRKGKKIKPHILSGSWQHVMSVSVVGVLRLVWQFSRD